jgi:very-short-patch-repair endonuclease
MGILIYGPDRPKFGHEQSPDGSISVQIENENTYSFETLPETVSWADLYTSGRRRSLPSQSSYRQSQMDDDEIEEEERDTFRSFIEELRELVGSSTEDKFLKLYAQVCAQADTSYSGFERGEFAHHAWSHPALIPQVWVNWYHFDPEDSERAQLAQEEPFRVDFMVKDSVSSLGNDLTVIEIDGPTHFGETEIGPGGELLIEAKMSAYTKHLKKDRWLRKRGWDVVRVSSQEVDDLNGEADLHEFYNDIMDRDYFIADVDLPF